jgi:hypothetical protein
VKGWPRPETLKDLRSFFRFASYYRRFVPQFANIARPLLILQNYNWHHSSLTVVMFSLHTGMQLHVICHPVSASKQLKFIGICNKQNNTQKSNKQLQTSWNENCTNAFEVMKENFTSSPVSGYADYTDASFKGIILSQHRFFPALLQYLLEK